MSRFEDRYGISGYEVANLHSRYRKNNLQEGFGTFDNFVKFASECGYVPKIHLKRYDESKPHSPENSYFMDVSNNVKHERKKSGPKPSGMGMVPTDRTFRWEMLNKYPKFVPCIGEQMMIF